MTEQPVTQTKPTSFTTNPTYDALERKLTGMAARWRATKDEQLVRDYHQVLNSLRTLGWQDWLDLDSELPEALLPEWYRKGEHIQK